MTELTALDVLIRIVVATVLAGPSGMSGSTIAARRIADEHARWHRDNGHDDRIARDGAVFPDAGAVDVSRIASTILTGIGFYRRRNDHSRKGSVHGLTEPAAGIWVVASIGMSLRMGLFHCVIATILTCDVGRPARHAGGRGWKFAPRIKPG